MKSKRSETYIIKTNKNKHSDDKKQAMVKLFTAVTIE